MSVPTTGFPFLDEPVQRGGIVALAHRGGRPSAEFAGVENTMRAFEAAVALGYTYLETDVQATSDGVLLAFHDDQLDRVTDRRGRISELQYDEAAKALVDGREPIPVMAELFEALPGARFNIDLKHPATVDPMVDLIGRMRVQDRVCIGSFHEPTLRRFRRQLGDLVPTTCGVGAVGLQRFAPAGAALVRLSRDSGNVYQVPHRHHGLTIVDRRFVERVHAAGRHVHVWTVDERAEMEQLLDLGVDGLISDRIDVLREVLVERGLWEGTQ